ncbi:uncharacterized protein RHO25_007906 [Cercospora beticola]|uniref:Uncharacterized protein n=1 Tax=Cercospora beticola TaxID=122368 RepID=A0ABZ0NUQ4_CERBT|nr:hypothetical protein RHO25_007906 [Cercospora beticola]
MKRIWSSNAPVAITAEIPSPVKSRRGTVQFVSDVQLDAHEVTVDAFEVELFPGFDYHDSINPYSDEDWVGSISSIMKYMARHQLDCVQSILYGSDTDYENRVTVWLKTNDGANHRSC